MEIPIYYSYTEFEKNYKSDFAKWIVDFPDADENFYLQDLKFNYEIAIKNVTIISDPLDRIGQKSNVGFDKHYTISEIEGVNISREILDKIKSTLPIINDDADDEYGFYDKELEFYNFQLAKNLRFTFIKIVKFIDEKIAPPKIEAKNNLPDETPEIEPYAKEKGKGKNIPFKLALLRELGVLDTLNQKYDNNNAQLHRILDFLTGGYSKGYYLDMYGTDYNGKDKVTPTHTAYLRKNDLI